MAAGTQNTSYTNYGGAHGHSISGTSGSTTPGNTGGASGNTANSSAFNSGSTGSGTAINNMPPYLAVYMWERVA